MYFPLSQITTDLYTPGDELFTISNAQPYEGFYFKTSDGKFYTGKTPNDGPNLILVKERIQSETDAEVGNPGAYTDAANFNVFPPEYANATSIKSDIGLPPSSSINYPTEDDYEVGEYQRYYLKRNNGYSYKEIDFNTFTLYKNKDPQVQYFLYQPITATWNITGEAIDVYKVNKNIIKNVQQNNGWEGFINYFKYRFLKYYKPSKKETFYTKGGELKILKTSEEYIGYYHVHPDKGLLMEGRYHKSTFHNTLILIEENDVVLKAKIGVDEEVGTSRRINFPSINMGGGY